MAGNFCYHYCFLSFGIPSLVALADCSILKLLIAHVSTETTAQLVWKFTATFCGCSWWGCSDSAKGLCNSTPFNYFLNFHQDLHLLSTGVNLVSPHLAIPANFDCWSSAVARWSSSSASQHSIVRSSVSSTSRVNRWVWTRAGWYSCALGPIGRWSAPRIRFD